MEEIDRISIRVGISGVVGGIAGATRALLKGHPLGRGAALSASSMMMVATACFGLERVAATQSSNTVATHVIGGAAGGFALGFLYNGRPVHGVLFLTPIMAAAGYGQQLFDDIKQERIRELQKTNR